MAKSNASGLLTSLDSLFTTQEQRDAAKRDVVLDLPLDQIGDFPNHPFKVRQDEAMMEMMESVQLHGVLVPGLVRQLADGSYQMVSDTGASWPAGWRGWIPSPASCGT